MSNATVAEVPTITFTHATRHYTLYVYPIGTHFKAGPAVYVITRVDAQQRHSVIYVGQTEDIAARFDNHHKWSCMMQNGANCICAFVVRDEAERLAIENDLIRAYHPPCNG